MKNMATVPMTRPSAPLYQPRGPCVRQQRMAGRVQSITRAEIDHFWRRKKLEEEEHQLADEKEAARIRVRTLKQEEYVLFEQNIKGIIEGNSEKTMDGEITNNCDEDARNIQMRIGIKDWWRKSSCAYLNEPAVTSMDGNSAPKDTATYNPQKIHFRCCSQAHQINVTAIGIF
ncbi:uncharacterized protein [Lolium perenne]|uniref:uncharacterized protein n=1 Tax=Lolium perenne TaxID=4522 RepID=UPI0021F5522A|nr:uncharacterized protein LOC127306743 [Lolium perenne]